MMTMVTYEQKTPTNTYMYKTETYKQTYHVKLLTTIFDTF